MSESETPEVQFGIVRLGSRLRSLLGPLFHAEPSISSESDGSVRVQFGDRVITLNTEAATFLLSDQSTIYEGPQSQPSSPTPLLNTTERSKAEMLRREIGKVRCWLTGFHAGRGERSEVAGEDSLRQTQMFLADLCRDGRDEAEEGE